MAVFPHFCSDLSLTLLNLTLSYAGEYQNGVIYGRGVKKYTNGDYFEGTFVDGDIKTGHGRTTLTSSVYEGEYKHGSKCGKGVHTMKNGDVYSGKSFCLSVCCKYFVAPELVVSHVGKLLRLSLLSPYLLTLRM